MKISRVLLASFLIALLLLVLPLSGISGDIYQVARVIDGDTIKLANGERVRYIGINTPETKHPRKGVEYFGPEASAFNNELVSGKKVRLEFDIQKRTATTGCWPMSTSWTEPSSTWSLSAGGMLRLRPIRRT